MVGPILLSIKYDCSWTTRAPPTHADKMQLSSFPYGLPLPSITINHRIKRKANIIYFFNAILCVSKILFIFINYFDYFNINNKVKIY